MYTFLLVGRGMKVAKIVLHYIVLLDLPEKLLLIPIHRGIVSGKVGYWIVYKIYHFCICIFKKLFCLWIFVNNVDLVFASLLAEVAYLCTNVILLISSSGETGHRDRPKSNGPGYKQDCGNCRDHKGC